MANERLERLSSLVGIEPGWVDFFGRHRIVPDETRLAFLSAMGVDVSGEGAIADSLAELEARPWRRRLPPVLVACDRDGPPSIPVTAPLDRQGLRHRWTLREDNGALHTGEWRPCDLPLTDRGDAGRGPVGRFLFRLPGVPLPGVHRLDLEDDEGGSATMTVIIAPGRAHRPAALAGRGRVWGVATQLYALRREKNWGIGDFSDLAETARRMADVGAAAIGVNPLHALFGAQADRFSPYSPSSRIFLNTIFIDVEAVPDLPESDKAGRLLRATPMRSGLEAVRGAALVDYPGVAALKRPVLAACWDSFRDRHLGSRASARGEDFLAFCRAGGRTLRLFALFESLHEHFLARDPALGYWRNWPEGFRDPDGADVETFARKHEAEVGFHLYLQWIADQQLAAAAEACARRGMAVGLYRDLAVGIAADGAEAWANQTLLCQGVSVGAPPDPLNLTGQDWGLVPFNPLALEQEAYLPFLGVVEANMRHAGALRLDHAMSLRRLYWVPWGAKADQGAYVRYPEDSLFHLAVLASRRQNCQIIGEDLGTVPDGFRERMAERSILGYRLMVFEKEAGAARPAADYAEQTLVAFGTHDLPSLAGWWRGADIAEREHLALYSDPALGEAEKAGRARDRRQLVTLLAGEGVLDPEFPTGPDLSRADLARLAEAVHAFLARTPSKLLMVQFEDILGFDLQMNLPGTVDQHPNWRLRYPVDIATMTADPALRDQARVLTRERGPGVAAGEAL